MATNYKYFVSLRIHLFETQLAPKEISEILGMTPTRSWVKGEARTTSTGDKLEGFNADGYCCFSFDRKDDEDLNDSLERITMLLTPHAKLFKKISEIGTLELVVFWVSYGNSGVTIKNKILQDLTFLAFDIGFDIWGERFIPETEHILE